MLCTKFIGVTIVTLFLLSPATRAQQILCGSDLRVTLNKICEHGFYPKITSSSGNNVKRSDDKDNTNYEIQPVPRLDSPILNIILYSDTFNAITKTRRRRQYIHQECCLKGCTFSELQSYCSDDPSVK